MPPLPPNLLIPGHGTPIYFHGPELEKGALPSVFFFALSARITLFESPFNQIAVHLSQQGIRVFSWDLPFHGEGLDPHEGIRLWAHEFVHHADFIFDFLDVCQYNIDYLQERGLINAHSLGIAGLSRGGFIATHLAARDSRFKAILGFAPLTHPHTLEELKSLSPASFEKVSLISIAENLAHARLRFYIGNRDMRVGTESCFKFIHTLTEAAFNQGVRNPAVELIIYPSIGNKGHGTPPSIFHDGAEWMKQQLLN
jgi:dienelactone hydrolase